MTWRSSFWNPERSQDPYRLEGAGDCKFGTKSKCESGSKESKLRSTSDPSLRSGLKSNG